MKKFFRNIFVSATIIFQVIGLILVFIFGAQISSAIHPQPKPEWVFYRVTKGDSIFSIAQEICDPKDRKDPRVIVEEIKQKNKKKESKEIDEIERGIIYADQVIEIPLYTTPEAKREELREFSKTIQPGQI